MLRADASWPTNVPYSVFALLEGTICPVAFHSPLEMYLFSPRSVNAMMLRVFVVTPELLVTQISTRLIFTPDVRLGSDFMLSSYV